MSSTQDTEAESYSEEFKALRRKLLEYPIGEDYPKFKERQKHAVNPGKARELWNTVLSECRTRKSREGNGYHPRAMDRGWNRVERHWVPYDGDSPKLMDEPCLAMDMFTDGSKANPRTMSLTKNDRKENRILKMICTRRIKRHMSRIGALHWKAPIKEVKAKERYLDALRPGDLKRLSALSGNCSSPSPSLDCCRRWNFDCAFTSFI
ncbi:uncharacterized protein EI97DRAFT_439026 [Westerdykella ornata]|uniref:Uncharacterized protein n=1 Tax=Westerdykella ornata TaxID=318751 RepID=A0A6A6JY25_WESOR|nr:uncharacterized protein EI97DRAFT_439026 [Westerdykella ornata]KAF2279929.1 hypothetical protein EI97DRAFT_439026 [Westerdykella ornata]